ncbi:alpha/beta fold hydrolase [Archangium minus]|uniref:Alpha/beta fold hydrolase n=1 Tax=Archangium minus TaxID=83450 RepID=A0ABY9WU46_9BACT|nr:alpha/beta fold hydrolase [Archangium minus]
MPSSHLVALAFAATITLPSLGAAQDPAPPKPPRGPEGVEFYAFDQSTLPPEGKPGDVIWWRPLAGVAALKAAGSNELVLYRSAATDEKQTPITVSGIIALPPGSPPEGGWPVISWAHGTVGVGDKCAPSRDDEESLAHGINKAPHPLLNAYLRKGWAVVMTDYEGLGTPRPHPFLLGHSEARGILDMVRAAHKLHPGKLSKRFAIVGHSQGGQAALFAAADAKAWAPELELRTVIALAPASAIKPLFWLGVSGKEPSMGSAFIPLFLTGAIAGNPNIKPAELLASPEMVRLFEEAEEKCRVELSLLDSWGGVIPNKVIRQGANRVALDAQLTAMHPGFLKITAPVRLVQGAKDERVLPEQTKVVKQQLIDRKASVEYKEYPATDHFGVLNEDIAGSIDWLSNHP